MHKQTSTNADNQASRSSSTNSVKPSGGDSSIQLSTDSPEKESLQEEIDESPQVARLRGYQEMADNVTQVDQTTQFVDFSDSTTAGPNQDEDKLSEEVLLQGKFKPVQLQEDPETERSLPGKFDPTQKKEHVNGGTSGNQRSLPDQLKSGIEHLSGYNMDDVNVHYNSDKPTQFRAHAFARGTDIHLGKGQERHLPHEAWHVAQQKQGRVKPTMQMKGKVNVNDDPALESEADRMGKKALEKKSKSVEKPLQKQSNDSQVAQFVFTNIKEETSEHIDHLNRLWSNVEEISHNVEQGTITVAQAKQYLVVITQTIELKEKAESKIEAVLTGDSDRQLGVEYFQQKRLFTQELNTTREEIAQIAVAKEEEVIESVEAEETVQLPAFETAPDDRISSLPALETTTEEEEEAEVPIPAMPALELDPEAALPLNQTLTEETQESGVASKQVALKKDCKRLIAEVDAVVESDKMFDFFFELADYFRQRFYIELDRIEATLEANPDDLITLHRVYKEIQELNVMLSDPAQKHRIIEASVGSGEEDAEAMEVLKGDIDYRVKRLVTSLQEGKKLSGQNAFKSVLVFLGGDNRPKLKERYAIVRERSLDLDLKVAFGGESSLQYLYLKQVLENGQAAIDAQLALKLGLLYEGWSPAKLGAFGAGLGRLLLGNMEDDTRVAQMIAEHTSALSALVGGGGPKTVFIQKIHDQIKEKGVFGELKALVAVQKPENEEGQQKSEQEKSQDQSSYLMSLIFNKEKQEYRIAVGHGHWRIQKLKDRLIEWGGTMASSEEQKSFVYAGKMVYGIADPQPQDLNNSKVNEYKKFWRHVKGKTLMVDAKALYVIKIVEGKYLKKSRDEGSKLNELEAVLDLHAATKGVIKKRIGRSNIKHVVMQYLSVTESGNFDPQLALIERYHPSLKDDQEKLNSAFSKIQANTPQARKLRKKLIDESFVEFKPLLVKSKLTDSQIKQVHQFILIRGSEGDGGDDFNKVATYMKLKKMASNHDYNASKVLQLVQQLEPGSMEFHLVKNDIGIKAFIEADVVTFSRKNKKWKAIQNILKYGSSDETSSPVGVPEVLTPGDVSKMKGHQLDQRKPEYWAGKLSAEYRIGKDGNKALEIAYQASNENVDGTKIATELKEINNNAYQLMVNRKGKAFQLRGEHSAYKTISKYLNDNTRISVTDIVHAARAVTKFGVYSEGVDFAVESITEQNVFEFVEESTYKKLEHVTNQRFNDRLALHEAQQAGNQKESEKIQVRIEKATKEINDFELRIDENLLKKFSSVSRTGKFAAIKRQIYTVLGSAMQKGQKSTLKLSPEEAQFKGTQTKGKADVLNQKYLESGVTWDHRSTIAAETSESMGGFLSTIWQHQEELQSISSKSNVTSEDQDKRKELLKELAAKESDLSRYQELFKAAQDKFNEQTKKIITTIVTLLITIAGLSVGVGASLGVIQLIWAIGASLIESAVVQMLEVGLSRQGDFSKAVAAKDTVVKLFSDIVAFAVVSELTLAVDLMGIGLHTGSHAQKLFGKPALGVLKGQITSVVGDMPEALINQFFKKHPVSGLGQDIKGAFVNKIKALPMEVVVGFLKGFATEGFRMGNEEIMKAMNIEGAKWTPSGSAVANKYDDPSNVATAKDQFMGFSDGGWDFNNMGQFVGGPKTSLGADESALNPLAGVASNYDTSKLPSYLLNATKTALYEEFVVSKIQGAVGGASKNVLNAAAGKQDPNASVTKPAASKDDSDKTRHEQKALTLVIDYMRHIGLSIPDTEDAEAVRAEIRKQTKGEQTVKTIKMFNSFINETVGLLEKQQISAQKAVGFQRAELNQMLLDDPRTYEAYKADVLALASNGGSWADHYHIKALAKGLDKKIELYKLNGVEATLSSLYGSGESVKLIIVNNYHYGALKKDPAGEVEIDQEKFKIIHIAPDGDCFFASVQQSAGIGQSVKALRKKTFKNMPAADKKASMTSSLTAMSMGSSLGVGTSLKSFYLEISS